VKKLIALLIVFLIASLSLIACKGDRQKGNEEGRLKVVTTLFPLFDFVGQVGGNKVNAILLLPPGVEPHDFEPKPKDIATIQEADVFVYTGNAMEPWAQRILKGIDSKKLVVVDASRGITLRSAGSEDHEGHSDNNSRAGDDLDPHIWLDFAYAQVMVKNIADGLSKKDPKDSDYYTGNASAYNNQLQQLDEEYRAGLSTCKTRFFLFGGHYAFNYLAGRYNLSYVSVHGASPNAEPLPAHLVGMVNTMKQHHLNYIFYEELASPRIAETIARETGAKLLPLTAAHTVSKEQMAQHISFIDIMKTNLAVLREGMQCR
jgi:zinc transport system substrate-binding protein